MLLIRMNAAETSASIAIADWTPLAVVLRSLTTAEIETFISDVSTTSTNMAMARSRPRMPGPSVASVGRAADTVAPSRSALKLGPRASAARVFEPFAHSG